MIVDGFVIAGLIVCLLSTVICIGAAIVRQPPNDITILSVAAVEVFLVVYLVSAVVRQSAGQAVSGEGWEFWGYLVTALLVPVGAFWWAVLERSRWSNIVLGAAGVTIFVMLVRMEQIWDGAAAI